MRKYTKIWALLISLLLAACLMSACAAGGEGSAVGGTGAADGETAAAGSETSFKFGFIHTSFSDQLGIMYQKYASYAAKEPGCEIRFAENGSDADLRMSSLENMLPQGKLCVEWELKPEKSFVMRLEIPVGTVARICLPARLFGTEAPDIEGMDCRVENGMAVFHTGSGKYLIKGQ